MRSKMIEYSGFEIYIHIPFCVRKCGYCDFLSFPAGKDVQTRYMEALKREIRLTGEMLRRQAKTVSSVFFGGGTPSVPEEGQIAGIMQELHEQFSILPDAEITIEANPGTVDLSKLRSFRSAGINRISIGCQSMHDSELVRMGRIHDRAAFLESYELARKAGFDNINLDLISALPGQSLQSWRETLHAAAALEPEHISAYSLILEEGTPFFEQRDTLQLPDEDTEREMYEETAEILSQYGFQQYELSNYAKPGRVCRHNLGYWTGVPYLGMGLGAASYWPAEPAGADREEQEKTWMVRFRKTADLKSYLHLLSEDDTARIPEDSASYELLGKTGCMAEFMILGLRLTDGISRKEFRCRFQNDLQDVFGGILQKYAAAGLLHNEEDRVFLTRRGRSLANVVMMEFL